MDDGARDSSSDAVGAFGRAHDRWTRGVDASVSDDDRGGEQRYGGDVRDARARALRHHVRLRLHKPRNETVGEFVFARGVHVRVHAHGESSGRFPSGVCRRARSRSSVTSSRRSSGAPFARSPSRSTSPSSSRFTSLPSSSSHRTTRCSRGRTPRDIVVLLAVARPRATRGSRRAARKQQIAGPWDEALPKLYLFKNTERASGAPRYRHWAANK